VFTYLTYWDVRYLVIIPAGSSVWNENVNNYLDDKDKEWFMSIERI
jgi:hypothetical protein